MAGSACRTLLALLVTLCTPRFGFSADKAQKKQPFVDKSLRPGWESSILLDGTPVDRFVVSSKPGRSHRFTKWEKGSKANLFEDVDPDWLNLDGFAVLSAAPVNSAVPVRPRHSPVRNSSSVHRSARVNRTLHPQLHPAPGPLPPGLCAGPPSPPRADQRRQRQAPKLTSESVHVVSLQAPNKAGQSTASRGTAAKSSIPDPPPEYEARDISVRVMSPKSVLISWVDPAVEMGKVESEAASLRSYTVRYREKGESARWEYKDSGQRRMMVEDLSADGMYEFSVRINQGDNQGKWSVSVFQRTPESAPSGPPENFEVKPLRGKGTAIIATWDPPDEPNGRIREYILSYAPAMKPFGMKSLTYSGSTTSATVDGLTPGDRYIFKIRATNRKGQGPQSKAFSVVMPGSSRAASTSSRKTEVSRTTQAPVDQDDYEESNSETTPAPFATSAATTTITTTTTTTHRVPPIRRVRPLSQTRSYHNIFSSVRGSVRNGHRGSKIREQTTMPPTTTTTTITTTVKLTTTTPETTTPPPVQETTTEEVKTEQNNDVFDKEREASTTAAPNFKLVTPPSIKKAKSSQRRPIKIRVHQKTGSKTNSLAKTDISASNSQVKTTTKTPGIQESAAKRNDFAATAVPESKNVNDASIQSKKPSLSLQNNNSQPDKTQMSSRGSVRGTSGSAGRYNFNRRNPSFFVRGNLTRNGFKPALTSAVSSDVNVQSRSQSNHGTLNRFSKSESGSNRNDPRRGIFRQETSHGLDEIKSTNAQEKLQNIATTSRSSDGRYSNVDPNSKAEISESLHSHTKLLALESAKLDNTKFEGNFDDDGEKAESSNSRTQGKRTSNSRSTNMETVISDNARNSKPNLKNNQNSESESIKYDTTNWRTQEKKTHSSPSVFESVKSDDEQNSRETLKSTSDGNQHETSISNAQISQSPSRTHSPVSESSKSDENTNSNRKEGNYDTDSDSTKKSTSNSKTQTSQGERTGSSSRARISSSLLEKYPWLATKYPHRFGLTARSPTSTSNSRTSLPRTNSSTMGLERPISRSVPTRVSSATGAAGVSAIQETSQANEENKNNPKLESLKNNVESVKPNLNKEVSKTTQVSSTSSSKLNEQTNSEEGTDHENHKIETNNENFDRKNSEIPSVDATNSRTFPSSTLRRTNTGNNGRIRYPLLPNRQLGNRFSVRPAQKMDSESEAKPMLMSGSSNGNGNTLTRTGGLFSGGTTQEGFRGQGGRTRNTLRGKPINGGAGFKPVNRNDKNGRPNLTTAEDKETATFDESSKSNGHRYITGPDGTKWLVDLERGVLMNSEGQILQDSQGKPRRVVLGEDGHTIFDSMGSPLVNQEGVALFGHGRDSRPVVNPKDKMIMLGGKPLQGLDVPKRRTTTTTAKTTTTTTTTTTEALTTEWTSPPIPTCPPGTSPKTDDYGYPEVDEEGILDCYPIEEESSGMDEFEKDELIPHTTLPPSTTSTVPSTEGPRPSNKGPSNELDLSGKKRFTAPYVNYIQKDPGAPCSLTEALEYLQVDVLENLLEKDNLVTPHAPPKNKPHNLTVVAMEGCHSFIILDWAQPLKNDMVSGFMVYSASYDDVLNNRWSSRSSSGTHLAVENLKPNSRYYFKVQARNVFGVGPFSETLTYVTESDDPLLIERPPGGEPIWIPFSFKYNSAHSSCKGSQFVKRTWYRKFVGVVLCNSLRYKIFMGDGLREPFYSIGDTLGQGEDHCQFVDSYRDGRTGPAYMSNMLPSAQGYYRAYRQEPVTFGVIGRRTNHPFVGWYECGVPIPGKW
ncbi:hypothetical protein WMY93_016272 [Mugilogobius chulae]|uniref:Fibronectin type-III domain-containing protein n=1 Tax=Mugilogobius chulae TaxID=88201 RepID=A0AAW0NZM1_9GOBI